MTQYSVIVPICFVLTSGCALFDDLAPTTELAPVPITVSEKEQVVPPMTAVEVSDRQLIKPPPIPRRALRVDEVRRLQTQLRRIGFDPGPIDGIVGARTLAAFGRLHATCEKLGPSIESFHVLAMQESSARVVSIDETETRSLQGELRGVGLDPGPVDGIFGKRTRSMVEQLHGSCLMAKESGAILRDVSPTAPNDRRSGICPLRETPPWPRMSRDLGKRSAYFSCGCATPASTPGRLTA